MALQDFFRRPTVIEPMEGEDEVFEPNFDDVFDGEDDSQTSLTSTQTGASIEMKVVKPTTYKLDEVKKFGDLLLSGKTVLLNLESTPLEDARRLLDFLTGVVHAVDGKIETVGKKTFVATPHNVDVTGSADVIEEESYEQ